MFAADGSKSLGLQLLISGIGGFEVRISWQHPKLPKLLQVIPEPGTLSERDSANATPTSSTFSCHVL